MFPLHDSNPLFPYRSFPLLLHLSFSSSSPLFERHDLTCSAPTPGSEHLLLSYSHSPSSPQQTARGIPSTLVSLWRRGSQQSVSQSHCRAARGCFPTAGKFMRRSRVHQGIRCWRGSFQCQMEASRSNIRDSPHLYHHFSCSCDLDLPML